jgi:putative ABC transport system permease protein
MSDSRDESRPPGWRPAFRLPLGRRVESEIDDEIAFHIAMREEQLRQGGLSSHEAQDAARRRFGDVEHVRQECVEIDRGRARRERVMESMGGVMQDIVIALRSFRRARSFTAAAVITLAIGIGSSAAIFSVAYGVLLRPLPFPAADRLLKLGASFSKVSGASGQLSAAEYLDVRSGVRAFDAIGAYSETDRTLGGDGRPERVTVAYTTASLFQTLGVTPLIGRTYNAEEDQPGGPQLVVLSHALWTRRFNADSRVLGTDVVMDGVPRTVLGVLPSSLHIGAAEAYLPSRLRAEGPGGRGNHYLHVIARLRPDATVDAARAELAAYVARVTGEFELYRGSGFSLDALGLREALYGDMRPTMLALLATVLLLLLLASTNVANLLLVRAETRQREMGIRVALGAGRGRLVRQLLTESLVLSVVGALLGVPLALLGVRALIAVNPTVVPVGQDIGLDAGVLLAVAAIVALAALAAGVLPALRAGRTDVRSVISAGSSGGGREGGALRSTLVVAEVALAAMMLVGAGLVGRSFWKLQSVDPGFDAEGALVMDLSLPSRRYDSPARVIGFYARALDGLRSLPGVRSAAAISHLPLSGNAGDWMLEAEGRSPSAPRLPSPEFTIASTDVFRALGIAVREGRVFDSTDRPTAPPVVVVSRELSRAFWPGESSVLGRRVRFAGAPPGRTIPWMTVVGVVDDVRRTSLSQAPHAGFYLLDTQFPHIIGDAISAMTLVVRTQGDPSRLAGAARAVVGGIDPELAVANERTLASVVSSSVARPRFAMAVLSAFGLSALLLAAVGVYGVLSYAMARRRREMAVRMAMGATPRAVRRLALGAGLRLGVIGVAAGLVLAVMGSRLLRSLLFEVSATDPLTIAAVGTVLLGAALLASWLPARRATTVSPAEVLRGD